VREGSQDEQPDRYERESHNDEQDQVSTREWQDPAVADPSTTYLIDRSAI
jgi:hypothetical protein